MRQTTERCCKCRCELKRSDGAWYRSKKHNRFVKAHRTKHPDAALRLDLFCIDCVAFDHWQAETRRLLKRLRRKPEKGKCWCEDYKERLSRYSDSATIELIAEHYPKLAAAIVRCFTEETRRVTPSDEDRDRTGNHAPFEGDKADSYGTLRTLRTEPGKHTVPQYGFWDDAVKLVEGANE